MNGLKILLISYEVGEMYSSVDRQNISTECQFLLSTYKSFYPIWRKPYKCRSSKFGLRTQDTIYAIVGWVFSTNDVNWWMYLAKTRAVGIDMKHIGLLQGRRAGYILSILFSYLI